VEGNPLFVYEDNFNPNHEEVEELKERYRKGTIGDVEVKRRLAASVNTYLAPLRARRAELSRRPGDLLEILREGTRHARMAAELTLAEVEDKMGLQTLQVAGVPEQPL
jgi:tryptophanyl-tRNA synthetase